MQPVIKQIHRLLLKNRKSIAVAESCTGGLLCAMLTQVSGSSQYFILGIVAYSNNAKETILKVPHMSIAKKGAVSKEVARKLAESVRKLAGADFGIGVTGIAGPTGATPQKPIGTVYISIDTKNKNLCKKFIFKGNRSVIRKKAAIKALELLKTVL